MGYMEALQAAERAAKKIQPPGLCDTTGQDQDDYRQEAFLYASQVLAALPAGAVADHYLARAMKRWVCRQWARRARTPRRIELQKILDPGDGTMERYDALEQLIDLRRLLNQEDWEVLVSRASDRCPSTWAFRSRLYRARRQMESIQWD